MQNKSTEIAGGAFLCFGKIKPDCTAHGDGRFLRWYLRLMASKLGQAVFPGIRNLCDSAFFPGNLGPLPTPNDSSRCRRWLEVLEAVGASGHPVWAAQTPQTLTSCGALHSDQFSLWVLSNSLKSQNSSMNFKLWANLKVWKCFEPLSFMYLPYRGVQNSVRGLWVWSLHPQKPVFDGDHWPQLYLEVHGRKHDNDTNPCP